MTVALLSEPSQSPGAELSGTLELSHNGLIFYLGTHKPRWLWAPEVNVPLCVSFRTLSMYKIRASKPRRALQPWILDSGGFSELARHGRWTITPEEYVEAVILYATEIGNLAWAAPQDMMCEPAMITGGMAGKVRCVGTGLDLPTHQWRTLANFIHLCDLWRERTDLPCPFIPVLQGWVMSDYRRMVEMYEAAGIDLASFPAVGVGSVCRRSESLSISYIMMSLAMENPGIRLHGFGVKTQGLGSYAKWLASADSTAWSLDATHNPPLPGHTHQHCGNCLTWALRWRANMLGRELLGLAV